MRRNFDSMTMVCRVFLGIFLIFLAAATPSRAEEKVLDYQAVMHVRSSNSFPVLDNKSHIIGIAQFRGLAILPDDNVVVHRYEGWFDLVRGSGKFHGHAMWAFDDGAILEAAYDGEAKASEDGSIRVSATFHDFSGTGRFANVSGSGSFSGRRLDDFKHGGSTHVKGRLVLDVN